VQPDAPWPHAPRLALARGRARPRDRHFRRSSPGSDNSRHPQPRHASSHATVRQGQRQAAPCQPTRHLRLWEGRGRWPRARTTSEAWAWSSCCSPERGAVRSPTSNLHRAYHSQWERTFAVNARPDRGGLRDRLNETNDARTMWNRFDHIRRRPGTQPCGSGEVTRLPATNGTLSRRCGEVIRHVDGHTSRSRGACLMPRRPFTLRQGRGMPNPGNRPSWRRPVKQRIALLPAVALLGAACASYTAPTPVGIEHPANADAPSPPVAPVAVHLIPDDLDRAMSPAAWPGPGGIHQHPDARPEPGPGHSHPGHEPGSAATPARERTYSCPMHPEVKQDEPGRCPECGMKLVEKKDEGGRR